MQITLVNIYSPNVDDPGFFHKVFDKLPDLSNTNLIITGNYNVILDCHLDTSSQTSPPLKCFNNIK